MDCKHYFSMIILMLIMCIILLRDYNLLWWLLQERSFQSQFFSNLAFIVNIVCSSTKRHDELQAVELDGITQLLEMGELETGKRKNQIGIL